MSTVTMGRPDCARRVIRPWPISPPAPVTSVTGRRIDVSVVAVEETADPAEDRTFLAAAAGRSRRSLVNAVRHTAQRERLQPDATGTRQGREKQPLTSEQRRFDLTDELDVVVDRWLQR